MNTERHDSFEDYYLNGVAQLNGVALDEWIENKKTTRKIWNDAQNSRTIYTLTCVGLKNSEKRPTRRCTETWFHNLEDAKKSAINDANFYEDCGMFDHIVIEPTRSCDRRSGRKKHIWFEIKKLETPKIVTFEGNDYEINHEGVELLEAPKGVGNIGQWWAG